MLNYHPSEALERALKNAGVLPLSTRIFMDWPSLEKVATQFLYYVSPWLVVNERNVAEDTLRSAVLAYDRGRQEGEGSANRAFIEAITESVDALVSVRVSVMDKDGLWSIWSYDVPLMSWMERHKRWTIQIRPRDEPVGTGPVLIKLLAAISSTHELDFAALDFSRLLAQRTRP